MNAEDQKDVKAICEKPVTRKQIDALLKKYHLKQSHMTYDCMIAAKQFQQRAWVCSKYKELLAKYILFKRNANAYRWMALYIAIYEYKFNLRFIEDADDIIAKYPMTSTGKIIISLTKISKIIEYDLKNDECLPPLSGTDYNLSLPKKVR